MNVELLLKARVNGKEVTVDVDQDVAPESVSQFVSNHCEELNKKVSELAVQEGEGGCEECASREEPGTDASGVKKEEATA